MLRLYDAKIKYKRVNELKVELLIEATYNRYTLTQVNPQPFSCLFRPLVCLNENEWNRKFHSIRVEFDEATNTYAVHKITQSPLDVPSTRVLELRLSKQQLEALSKAYDLNIHRGILIKDQESGENYLGFDDENDFNSTCEALAKQMPHSYQPTNYSNVIHICEGLIDLINTAFGEKVIDSKVQLKQKIY